MPSDHWSSVQLLLRLMGENGLVYHFQDLHGILMPVLAAMAGVLFLEGGLGAGSCSTWVWDVPKISLFPKILSLKSSGTWYGNPYTKVSYNRYQVLLYLWRIKMFQCLIIVFTLLSENFSVAVYAFNNDSSF